MRLFADDTSLTASAKTIDELLFFLCTIVCFYMTVSDNKPCNFPLLLVSEQHDYFTRSASAQQLQIPHSRINIRKFCPTVIGKYYWNDLPLHIRNKSSKILFKKALKIYYLAQY